MPPAASRDNMRLMNCQISVFAGDATKRGHAFIDRELCLLKSWTDDKARMAQAHVPQEIIESAANVHATKPALARAMIERAVAAKDPFSHGAAEIETALRRKGISYVLGVKPEQPFHSRRKPLTVGETADEIANRLPPSAWMKLPSKTRAADDPTWHWAYVKLADIDAGQVQQNA